MKNSKKIACPRCGKPNTWLPDNSYKPFCSDRCKLIDLGEWANENRKIPAEQAPLESSDEDFEN